MVLIGNSAVVKSRGKRKTWPVAARGRKTPKYGRSFRAMREKAVMTRRMAFSWICQPKKKDA
jgi:hypothetical protein